MTRYLASLLLGMLLLSGCSKHYPFPVTMPSNAELKSRYTTLEHNLSTMKRYHFRITLPTDWKSLDTQLDRDPRLGELLDVGAFREPGEWMTNSTALAKAEIAVNVFRESGSGSSMPQGHRGWLIATLESHAPEFDVIQERTVQLPTGPEPDLLVRYGEETDRIIARIRIVPAGDGRVFVITGSTPETEYERVAEDLFVGLESFKPVEQGTGTGVTVH